MVKLVEVSKLSIFRGTTQILKGVDLAFEAGEPFAIIGESGSGKTTLLYSIVGLIPIASGEIQVAGQRITSLSARERARIFGLVFQDFQLFPHLSVLENLLLAPKLNGLVGQEPVAMELLKKLRIESLSNRFPHQLSGGQKQRVAIARSLILGPNVLFLDEPSAALDAKTTDELADLLVSLNETTQVVVVSHDLQFIRRCCKRGARVVDGQIRNQGTLDELLDLSEKRN